MWVHINLATMEEPEALGFKSRLEYAENIRGMKVLYGWM
jgi:hypothetical protein